MRSSAVRFRRHYLSVCISRNLATAEDLLTDPTAVIATGLGAIPLGSPVAFLNLAGSFIILTTTSYAIPFAANVVTGRKYFPPGPFYLGKLGLPVNILAVLFIVLFNTFYCFRK